MFQHYASQHAFKGAAYQVEDASGQIFTGTLDAQGHAAVAGLAPGPAKVQLGKDPSDTWALSSYIGKPHTPDFDSTSPALPGKAATQIAHTLLAAHATREQGQ